MFTGIIETIGAVLELTQENTNLHLRIESPITQELKIDQSVAHNGVCLTVVATDNHSYTVTAIQETLQKTNLGHLQAGDLLNLERCMKLGDRLDGHIVQGHVDQIGTVTTIDNQDGSWLIGFHYQPGEHVTVSKGSICVNGTSLTVVESRNDFFSVAIIPYTWEHTNFHKLVVGSVVNLEFDIIGKYIARLAQR